MPATVRSVARTLNRSARSFDDVTKLAERAPAAAKTYLKDVATRLREFGQVAKAKAIEDVLDAPDLAGSIKAHQASLEKIWPDRDGGWGAVQAERANTIGWMAGTNRVPPVYVQGEIELDKINNGAVLVTENGHRLPLVRSNAEMSDWFGGMVGDGNVTLKGKLDVNGNFKVSGFALNTDGKFNEFVFGRVRTTERRVFIETDEGEVNITSEELKKKLKQLPSLGVILPGEASGTGSRKKYDKNPSDFFALGRFVDTTVQKPTATVKGKHAMADFAMSIFASQPFVLPQGQERRADHSSRFWARGDFKYLREGKDEWGGARLTGQFVATYLSKAADAIYMAGYADSDADAVQAAVMLAEADDDLPGTAKAASRATASAS